MNKLRRLFNNSDIRNTENDFHSSDLIDRSIEFLSLVSEVRITLYSTINRTKYVTDQYLTSWIKGYTEKGYFSFCAQFKMMDIWVFHCFNLE